MDSQVKKVLARYYEDPQDSINPTGKNVPFLEYLMKKAPEAENQNYYQKGTPGKDLPGVSSVNVYINEDPSSMPKQVDHPFIKEINTHPISNKPEVFEEDSPLGQWQKSRRKDWTTPPREQAPAISIDRRFASVSNVIAHYLMDHMPLEMTGEDFDRLGMVSRVAASLNQVLNKDFHYKNDKKMQRSDLVRLSWQNQGNINETKRGKFVWTADSTTRPIKHTIILQFLQADEGNPEAEGASEGSRYIDIPVKLSCSCESFLWFGAQWYAVQGGYMYMPGLRRDLMPPTSHTQMSRKRRGKGLNFRVCKHILAVYDEIKNWKLETSIKELVEVTPLSKIMNPKEFERLLGVPFSYMSIKDALQKARPMTPKMRNFFRYKVQGTKLQKKALSKLDRWYFTKYRKMSEPQKINALETFIMHPEEIFYIMLRDAVVNNGRISDNYIKEGVILMSHVIDPSYGFEIHKGNLEAVPGEKEVKQEGLEGVPEDQKEVGKGTGIVTQDAVEQYRQDREEHQDRDEEDTEEKTEDNTNRFK